MNKYKKLDLTYEQLKDKICQLLDSHKEELNFIHTKPSPLYFWGCYEYLINILLIVCEKGIRNYDDFIYNSKRALSFLSEYKFDSKYQEIIIKEFWEIQFEYTNNKGENKVTDVASVMRKHLPKHTRLLGNQYVQLVYIMYAIFIHVFIGLNVNFTDMEPALYGFIINIYISIALCGYYKEQLYGLKLIFLQLMIVSFSVCMSLISENYPFDMVDISQAKIFIKLSFLYLSTIPIVMYRNEFYRGPKANGLE